ncbi:hypothetical protein ACLOJK_007197 [Asimina triloba]
MEEDETRVVGRGKRRLLLGYLALSELRTESCCLGFCFVGKRTKSRTGSLNGVSRGCNSASRFRRPDVG